MLTELAELEAVDEGTEEVSGCVAEKGVSGCGTEEVLTPGEFDWWEDISSVLMKSEMRGHN